MKYCIVGAIERRRLTHILQSFEMGRDRNHNNMTAEHSNIHMGTGFLC